MEGLSQNTDLDTGAPIDHENGSFLTPYLHVFMVSIERNGHFSPTGTRTGPFL